MWDFVKTAVMVGTIQYKSPKFRHSDLVREDKIKHENQEKARVTQLSGKAIYVGGTSRGTAFRLEALLLRLGRGLSVCAVGWELSAFVMVLSAGQEQSEGEQRDTVDGDIVVLDRVRCRVFLAERSSHKELTT